MFLRTSVQLATALALALLPVATSAHSVISPASTLTSKYETFSLGVPSEKDEATVSMRLAIPEGLEHVSPIVKPGWRVAVSKDAEGNVTQLAWTGGVIPPEQKDFFQFSARTPSEPTTLIWKAYQTYQGGEVVAWDQNPHHEKDRHDASGVVETVANPYSTTEVVAGATGSSQTNTILPNALALAALALSALALVITLRNKKIA